MILPVLQHTNTLLLTQSQLWIVPYVRMTHAVRAPEKSVVDCGYPGLEGLQ